MKKLIVFSLLIFLFFNCSTRKEMTYPYPHPETLLKIPDVTNKTIDYFTELPKLEHERIALLPITPIAIGDGNAILITSAVQKFMFRLLNRNQKYELVDRASVENLIQEINFQNTEFSSYKWMTEIGNIYNIQKVIIGKCGILGSSYYLNLQLIDLSTGRIINISDGTIARSGSIVAVVKKLVPKVSVQLFQY